MEKKTYYSIKFEGNSRYHKSGDILKTDEPVINIGESADCDIRFEKPDDCIDDLYYATIKRGENCDKWVLIKRSPLIDIHILGREDFSYMITLLDNDVIEFEGQKQSLRFSLHHDTKYVQSGLIVVQKSNNKLVYILLTLFAVALVGISGVFYTIRPREIRADEVMSMENAILRIDVDSVEWYEIINDKEIRLKMKHCEEDGKSSGTAFITEDNHLVTARHCIEYWLGMSMSLTDDIDMLSDSDIRRWAAIAETYNYTHEDGDTIMALRSYCSLYDKAGKRLRNFVSSTADNTYIDRSHDGIITLDNFSNRYYWRTITPYFVNREMELGDIFCMPMAIKGIKSNIRLADAECIHSLKQVTPLAFYGYPANERQEHILRFETGKITQDYDTDSHNKEHNIVHDGKINPGFSGGPVIARWKFGFVVVGVISKVDSVDNNLKLAVPVTAIKEGGNK